MKTENEIKALVAEAFAAGLDGLDFLTSFTCDQLADGYNGIGPEFLPSGVRRLVSETLGVFKAAALIHDLRNEMSDGTRKNFRAANEEFLRNCRKLAARRYGEDANRRSRAEGVAYALYAFVSAERFGWRAWLEAKERHEEKIASANPIWSKQ